MVGSRSRCGPTPTAQPPQAISNISMTSTVPAEYYSTSFYLKHMVLSTQDIQLSILLCTGGMGWFACATVSVVMLMFMNDDVDTFFLASVRSHTAAQSSRRRKLSNPTQHDLKTFDAKHIYRKLIAINLCDDSHVSHDFHRIQSSISGAPSSSSVSSNGGAGRRVLRLIKKVNDRLSNKDFSGPLWDAIRYEASAISEGDRKAATLMSNFILSQPSFDEAVMEFVANQLEQPLFQATQIRNLFAEICAKNPQMASVWALDLMASAMRDHSQPNAVSVLLFNKGFHSLVTYRIANALWYEGRDGLAIYFQSLSSRTFGSDIHPACTIGHGCALSSGTGVVIGETAIIGNDCFISHDVTLGGNGKDKGDRHPKVDMRTMMFSKL